MRLRQIARTLHSHPGAIFAITKKLCDQGIVVKQRLPRHKYDGYIALNRALPIHAALKKLLIALDRTWPVARAGKRAYFRRHMPYDANLRKQSCDVFCSRIRSQVLLLVAAGGTVDLETICQALSISYFRAYDAVERWKKQNILRTRIRGELQISLDPDFAAAHELRALLLTFVRHCPRWRALRALARSRMRKRARTNDAGRQHKTPG
jgi:hypothetical protein